MIALCSSILLASVAGSTHCAGMCGAFVALAVAQPEREARSGRVTLTTAYNLGRLVTYVVLGALAGGVGAVVDIGGSLVGVQRVAALFAAAMMAIFGMVSVARALGVAVPRVPLPAALLRVARAGHERAFTLSPIHRAAAVGLLTTVLPCGWLYAFVVVAAGTASPLLGAGAMTVFWLGTLPMMGALGLGIRTITGPLGRRMPLATSVLLVGVALWTVLGRAAMPTVDPRAAHALVDSHHIPCTHERIAVAFPVCNPTGK